MKEIADISVLQPEIEQKAVMAFATMTIWTLHNKFGFGKSRLRKFYLELSELGGSMKSSIAPVSLKDMQDTLKAECGFDFLGMSELPAVLGGRVYGRPIQ